MGQSNGGQRNRLQKVGRLQVHHYPPRNNRQNPQNGPIMEGPTQRNSLEVGKRAIGGDPVPGGGENGGWITIFEDLKAHSQGEKEYELFLQNKKKGMGPLKVHIKKKMRKISEEREGEGAVAGDRLSRTGGDWERRSQASPGRHNQNIS